jgi:hypothetical protein
MVVNISVAKVSQGVFTFSRFHPSLIFAGKPGAYLSGATFGASL